MSDQKKVFGHFTVSHYPNNESPTDIGFTPIKTENGRPPEDQYTLKLEIESFIVTLNEIYESSSEEFNYYYQRAFYLAQLGLEGSHIDTTLASRTLEQLKHDIVISAGSRVRNSLLKIYGIRASICSAIASCIAIVALNYPIKSLPLIPYFLFMLSGAMIGAWLSLGVRTKSFIFEEMRTHIRDHTAPYIRLAFTGILTLTAGLLMKIGALQISIGSLDSNNIVSDPLISLTFGILFGFSEKALITTLNDKTKNLAR